MKETRALFCASELKQNIPQSYTVVSAKGGAKSEYSIQKSTNREFYEYLFRINILEIICFREEKKPCQITACRLVMSLSLSLSSAPLYHLYVMVV